LRHRQCRSASRERTERRALSTPTKAHFFGIQAVRRDAQGLTGARDPGGDQQAVAQCSGAFIITILPSTIIGIDNAGGSKMLKDKKELRPPKRVKYGDNDCLLKPLLSPA
jgi:hypothetical protein